MDSTPTSRHTTKEFLADYIDIILGVVFTIVALFFHLQHQIFLSVLSAAIAIGAFSMTVAEIAEILADRLEEPYASFVLTFSAVVVEIVLLFMIIANAHDSVQGLETVKGGIISAVIVDMNVLLGLAVFIGGISNLGKHKLEQKHNEETSSTYTTILLVATSALLVPSVLNYTDSADKLFTTSVVIATLLMVFYIAIFIFQTKTHNEFFKYKNRFARMNKIEKSIKENGNANEVEEHEENYLFDRLPNIANFIAIFIFIFVIGILAEIFASDGMVLAKEYGISTGLAGLIIAIIAVSPEVVTAIKAAKDDEIQRVINIAMGASTVSIMLTVPVLMLLAYANGINLTLDFNAFQVGALLLTIILAWKTTDNGETNYFEGVSHLMFFAAYATIATMYH